MDQDNNRNNSTSGEGRGFASMDKDKQREIASEGGKAAHEKGTAHEFDSREASETGRKASHGNQHRNRNDRGEFDSE